MRLAPLADLRSGQVLARPVRAGDGQPLLPAGTVVQSGQIERLRSVGVVEAWICDPGEAVPAPAAPEYMDRYGPDFPVRLQRVFAPAMVNRGMQALFLAALNHASDCYRRYRLDGPGEDGG